MTIASTDIDVTYEVWDKFVATYGIGNRTQTSILDAAQRMGLKEGLVTRRQRAFRELGLMKSEIEFAWQKQMVYWTILKDAEEGKAILRDFFAKGGTLSQWDGASKKKPVEAHATGAMVHIEDVPEERRELHREAQTPGVVMSEPPITGPLAEAMRSPEIVKVKTEPVAVRYESRGAEKQAPVEAIAGPDAPAPFEALRAIRRNDAEGLLEAARQYANRQEAVNEAFSNLERLGMKIDREKAMEAISVEHDPVLDAVSALLPYISGMEAQIAQIGDWKQEIMGLRREASQLRIAYNQEKDANRRLAERNTQLAMKANGSETVSAGA